MPKLTIRQSTFETNSSSVHSLVIAKERNVSEAVKSNPIVVFDDYCIPPRDKVIAIKEKNLNWRDEHDALDALCSDKDDIYKACSQTTWRYGTRRRFDDTDVSDFKRRFETAVMYLPSAKHVALETIAEQRRAIRADENGVGLNGDKAFSDVERERIMRECRKHPCREGVIAALLEACERHGVDVTLAIDADVLCDAYEIKVGEGEYERTIIEGPGGVATTWIHCVKEMDDYADFAANGYKRLVDFVLSEDSQAYVVEEGEYDYDRRAYDAIGTFVNDGDKLVNGKYEIISRRLS